MYIIGLLCNDYSVLKTFQVMDRTIPVKLPVIDRVNSVTYHATQLQLQHQTC